MCPFESARKRNIIVVFEDLGSSVKGLYYARFRQKYIVINSQVEQEQQRSACAHVLSHGGIAV
ncbi:ImmA/IrrE family metallo-endopeptidase [Paenibacillus terrigena]|uniref:ImmA/IrrE family metallo-endopeptidase n=1 Tax=Paenibacillus terrigena TaxID=369333 RepID=UPI0028D3BA60|nr:ImmA/IrrE family metallo-endopeptidase [Paenibacillus terrigena]